MYRTSMIMHRASNLIGCSGPDDPQTAEPKKKASSAVSGQKEIARTLSRTSSEESVGTLSSRTTSDPDSVLSFQGSDSSMDRRKIDDNEKSFEDIYLTYIKTLEKNPNEIIKRSLKDYVNQGALSVYYSNDTGQVVKILWDINKINEKDKLKLKECDSQYFIDPRKEVFQVIEYLATPFPSSDQGEDTEHSFYDHPTIKQEDRDYNTNMVKEYIKTHYRSGIRSIYDIPLYLFHGLTNQSLLFRKTKLAIIKSH